MKKYNNIFIKPVKQEPTKSVFNVKHEQLKRVMKKMNIRPSNRKG